jgi:hypothetical protein
MITTIIIVTCLLAGNHYSWSGHTAVWADADNWGAMDYPQTGDDITVGQTWGTGWTPVTTINLMGSRSVNSIDVWPDYETTLTNGSITASEIYGNGSLVVNCQLTADSIMLDRLTIGSGGSAIPEPNVLTLISGFMVFLALFLLFTVRKK